MKTSRATNTVNRTLDLCAALLLGLLLTPLALLTRATGARLHLGQRERVGLQEQTFQQFYMRISRPLPVLVSRLLTGLPQLLNVIRGDMGIVGPRPMAVEELKELRAAGVSSALIDTRNTVRPGCISLNWIRRRGNIAYASELADDQEYVTHATPVKRTGMLLRAGFLLLYGQTPSTPPAFLRLLGVRMHNLDMAGAVDKITAWLDRGTPSQVTFVNADCMNRSVSDEEYRGVLNMADLTLADGSGVRLAGRIHRQPIRENVNGTDLFPMLCAALTNTKHSVFLLGGRPGIAEGVRDWMHKNHPGCKVAGLRDGYFSEHEEGDVVAEVRASGASLLLVALGAPRQDTWLSKHLSATGAQVGIGVGGLFDFYSGRIPRAPVWLREIGLEWIYRFLQEPKRMWKRYWIGNFTFIARVAAETVARRDGVYGLNDTTQEVRP